MPTAWQLRAQQRRVIRSAFARFRAVPTARMRITGYCCALLRETHRSGHIDETSVLQRDPAVHTRRQTLVVRYHHQAGAELHVQL